MTCSNSSQRANRYRVVARVLRCVAVSLFAVTCTAITRADNGWEGNILSLTWENDAVVGTDRHYTQGARLSYLSHDDAMWDWLQRSSHWLPALGFDVQAQKWGVAVSQEIYTPEDQQTSQLVLDDRPYAGWLYSTLTLQRRGAGPGRWLVRENVRLDLGVIGPDSLAEDAQRAFHNKSPKGWDHQLQSEFGINARYQRQYFFTTKTKEQSWGVDFIPQAEASVGNVDTHFGVGGMIRFGYQAPNEFEAVKQRTASHFGAYLFGGIGGRWVLRNIFLDGNSFEASHSVSKEPLVGEATGGITVVLKRVELTAAIIWRTREFDLQKEADTFGSAMVTLKF